MPPSAIPCLFPHDLAGLDDPESLADWAIARLTFLGYRAYQDEHHRQADALLVARAVRSWWAQTRTRVASHALAHRLARPRLQPCGFLDRASLRTSADYRGLKSTLDRIDADLRAWPQPPVDELWRHRRLHDVIVPRVRLSDRAVLRGAVHAFAQTCVARLDPGACGDWTWGLHRPVIERSTLFSPLAPAPSTQENVACPLCA